MVAEMLPDSVAKVNSVLILHADTPLPVAAIARAAGLRYTPAASALATLEKRGIAVRSRRAGKEEFGPNLDSVYYPAALVLALVDLPLDETLRGCLVSAVYAYGSMAAPGRATRNSDLDLMVVGDIPDHDALTARLADLGRNLGRAIDAFMLTPEQLETAQARGDAHVAAALAGVRVRGRI
jgi:predicted nucleotidyltransferase